MYDIIIIGSGPGGYKAATEAALKGQKVAIVERNELGGTCVNWGCIPTKALLKSAHVYAQALKAEAFGVTVENPSFSMDKIVDRSREVASNLSKGIQMYLKKLGVEVLSGEGHLVSQNRVEVDGTEYEARNIIIATGARSRTLPGIDVDHNRVLNSRDALALATCPDSIVIIGSGAIGSEFAFLYSTLGSKVTLVEYLSEIMPLEDEEISRSAERSFRKNKVTCMKSTKVLSVESSDEGCRVVVEGPKGEQTLEASYVLVAAGIKSNIENLGLEALCIEIERDKIKVNGNYQTSLEGVYAIGDIIATPALAHVATEEAVRCVRAILGEPFTPICYGAIPSCVFLSPEVGSVGLRERDAVSRGIEYYTGKYSYASSGRALASAERDGMVKLIFEKGSDRLLGAHIHASTASDMLGEVSVLVTRNLTLNDILDTVHAHPTFHEGILEAAEDALRNRNQN